MDINYPLRAYILCYLYKYNVRETYITTRRNNKMIIITTTLSLTVFNIFVYTYIFLAAYGAASLTGYIIDMFKKSRG
jgi:cell division protein FtsB